MFETPILLIIFKRKDTALKVLEVIKKIKPKYLYIAADGWRDENEKIKCLETRDAILKAIAFVSKSFIQKNHFNFLKIILNLFQLFVYQTFQPA